MAAQNSGSGISLSGALFLLFLGLKLGEIGTVATWSWWWVTSPLWIGAALVVVLGLVGAIEGRR